MSTLSSITSHLNPFKTSSVQRLGKNTPAKAPQGLSKDTFIKFGNNNPATQPLEATPWNKFKENGLVRWFRGMGKGALKGFFNTKRLGLELGLTAVGFIATLPLAFIIPGSHFLLLPLMYLGMRSANGAWGFAKGFFKPSSIIGAKPQMAAKVAAEAGGQS